MKNLKHFSLVLMTIFFSVIFSLEVISTLPGSSIAAVQAKSIKQKIPFVVISALQKELAVGDEFHLIAVTSTGKIPRFLSSSSSICSVNTYGTVTAKKPGTVKITAKISGAEASCLVTVRPTTIRLTKTYASLYRNGRAVIRATSSNGHPLSYRSNKSSVATVSDKGVVKALKHGDAVITIKCDTTKATFKVKVRQPTITLNKKSLTLDPGDTYLLKAKVSSNILPEWYSSNETVCEVNSFGGIEAIAPGRARIYCREDGVKKCCSVVVSKPETKTDSKKGK